MGRESEGTEVCRDDGIVHLFHLRTLPSVSCLFLNCRYFPGTSSLVPSFSLAYAACHPTPFLSEELVGLAREIDYWPWHTAESRLTIISSSH